MSRLEILKKLCKERWISINTTLGIYTHVFNNVTDSSRGIADTINKKFEKRGTTVTQTQEKTLEMR